MWIFQAAQATAENISMLNNIPGSLIAFIVHCCTKSEGCRFLGWPALGQCPVVGAAHEMDAAGKRLISVTDSS